MNKRHHGAEPPYIEWRKPQKIKRAKDEDERKYKIILPDETLPPAELYDRKVLILRDAFRYVARNNHYFRKLHKSPASDVFPAHVKKHFRRPTKDTTPRMRNYWADENLSGIDKVTGQNIAELRSEWKVDKGYFETTAKIICSDDESEDMATLHRGEYEVYVDGPGINFEVFPKRAEKHLERIYGDERGLRIPSLIAGQSTMVLFHPRGDEDVLIEIKFDVQEGQIFDGFTWPVVELETEIKATRRQIELDERDYILGEADQILFNSPVGEFLAATKHSKAAEGNRHLLSMKAKDPEGFKDAFRRLPRDRFEVSAAAMVLKAA